MAVKNWNTGKVRKKFPQSYRRLYFISSQIIMISYSLSLGGSAKTFLQTSTVRNFLPEAPYFYLKLWSCSAFDAELNCQFEKNFLHFLIAISRSQLAIFSMGQKLIGLDFCH
jgi:hypothetical protein